MKLAAANTVLRGAAGDLRVTVPDGQMADISISNSAVRGFPGAGNVDADPLFAGPSDYHLQPGSPLVDAGAPVPAGDLDLDGIVRPRGLAPDIGAYESPFAAMAAIAQPQPRPQPQAARPRPPRPFSVAPVIRSLSLRPLAFRAAAGTTVSFRLNVDARVTFRVQRRTRGAQGRKRCVRRTRRMTAKPCTLYVTLPGSYRRAGKRGHNAFRFRGLGARRLPAGSYRLRATARAGLATSVPRTARFRITRGTRPTASG